MGQRIEPTWWLKGTTGNGLSYQWKRYLNGQNSSSRDGAWKEFTHRSLSNKSSLDALIHSQIKTLLQLFHILIFFLFFCPTPIPIFLNFEDCANSMGKEDERVVNETATNLLPGFDDLTTQRVPLIVVSAIRTGSMKCYYLACLSIVRFSYFPTLQTEIFCLAKLFFCDSRPFFCV